MSLFTTCCKCGWVHLQLSLDAVHKHMDRFNFWFNNLSDNGKIQARAKGYLKPSEFADFTRCRFCNGPYTNFRDFAPGDVQTGTTIGSILSRDVVIDANNKPILVIVKDDPNED